MKNHLQPEDAMRKPATMGPIWEPAERQKAKRAIAVAKYRSKNISAKNEDTQMKRYMTLTGQLDDSPAIIDGPSASTDPAPDICSVL
jgi:hypothetical protein